MLSRVSFTLLLQTPNNNPLFFTFSTKILILEMPGGKCYLPTHLLQSFTSQRFLSVCLLSQCNLATFSRRELSASKRKSLTLISSSKSLRICSFSFLMRIKSYFSISAQMAAIYTFTSLKDSYCAYFKVKQLRCIVFYHISIDYLTLSIDCSAICRFYRILLYDQASLLLSYSIILVLLSLAQQSPSIELPISFNFAPMLLYPDLSVPSSWWMPERSCCLPSPAEALRSAILEYSSGSMTTLGLRGRNLKIIRIDDDPFLRGCSRTCKEIVQFIQLLEGNASSQL